MLENIDQLDKELKTKLQSVLNRTNDFLDHSIDHVVGIRDDVMVGLKELYEELAQVRNEIGELVAAQDAVSNAYRKARVSLADAETSGDSDLQAMTYEEAERFMKLRASFEERERYLRKRRDDLDREKVRMERIMGHSTDVMGKLRIAIEILRSRMNGDAGAEDDKDLQMIVKALQFAERESARLAREIHDGPIQQFAGSILLFEYLEKMLETRSREEIHAEVQRIKAQLRDSLGDFRGFLLQLQPVGLDKGIGKAIVRLVDSMGRRYGVRFELSLEAEEDDLPLMLRSNIFRVIQEAVSNSIRHGEAKSIGISMTFSQHNLFFRLTDDGVGFNVEKGKVLAAERGSFGLTNMAERIRFVNGDFQIISSVGKGTRIEIKVPLEGNVQ